MDGQFYPFQPVQFMDGLLAPPIGVGGEVKVKAGSFNTGDDVIGSTVVVSGVGFQPKAVIFFWSGRTGIVDAVGGQNIGNGMGFAASPTERAALYNFSADGSGATNASDTLYNDRVIALDADGAMDLQSFSADGFTLVTDGEFGNDYRIHYLAFGGDIHAKVGSFDLPAFTTGNQDQTGFGFTPSSIILAAPSSPLNVTVGTFSPITGAISNDNQFLVHCADQGGGDPTNTNSYARLGDECWGYANDNVSITRRASGSIIPGGFRLNVIEAAGGLQGIAYLAIGNARVFVGKTATRTDTTPWAVTGFGFPPKAVAFVSHCKAESAAETISPNAEYSFGVATGPSERMAVGFMDRDAVATTQTATTMQHDAVYANISTADVIEGLMDVVSFDNDGITLVMDDADPVASFVGLVAWG